MSLASLFKKVVKAATPVVKAAAPTIAVAIITHQAIKPVLVQVAKNAVHDELDKAGT